MARSTEKGAENTGSLARGLSVLLALSTRRPATAAELSDMSNTPLSSTYRYLKLLRAAGLVDEDSAGLYRPGPKVVQLALGTTMYRHIADQVTPALRAMSVESGESTIASVRVGVRSIRIAQVESSDPIRLVFDPGNSPLLVTGASGKVVLAYQTIAEIRSILDDTSADFPEALANQPNLGEQLAAIRQQGYCVSVGEVDSGASAVAAPVLSAGELLCSICIAGPERRIEARLDTHIATVVRVASELTTRTEANWT